jgi:cytochrome c peroxidase
MLACRRALLACAFVCAALPACRAAVRPGAEAARDPAWERENPVAPLPTPPLGLKVDFARAKVQVTPTKVRLGRWLFYDRRLSADGTVACASCHRPENAFSEPLPRSQGIHGQHGSRKAPPILNVAFQLYDHYFWDGRSSSLTDQVKGPLANPIEMGNTLDGVVATVRAIPGYRSAFREAFGDGRLDIERVAEAIAAYEATRLSGGSAYDRFEAGDDGALSELALAGREIFFGRGRCDACHLGPSFTDGRFHNIGVGYDPAVQPPSAASFADPGRYAVTSAPADIGAFKTPTLRDVAKRAPYMHDGSSRTLSEAVRRYIDVPPNPWLDPTMGEVRIQTRDVAPLVAFLEALDGTGYEDRPPPSFPQ